MARLVVTNQSLAGSIHELGDKWTTIGRADGNVFQLLEPSVSGRHCEVQVRGEKLLVRDLLSTNGTFIAGRKVTEGAIKPGEKLRLGDVELRFESSAPGTLSGAPFNSKMLVSSFAAAKEEPVPEQKAEPIPEPAGGAAVKFHVLFVDDSMAFLESFGALCMEFSHRTWQVHTAASADRALALMQQCLLDLVVVDIGMPMLDGLQLLGIIKRRHPSIKVAVITGSATEAKRADALANGAEVFLEKPVTPEGMRMAFNVLNDLVSWHNEGDVNSLPKASLPEIIQMECLSQRSVVLEIHNSEMRGQIYIEAGAITHAVAGNLRGKEAFNCLFALPGCEFELQAFQAPPERTIDCSWEQLLLKTDQGMEEGTVLVNQPATSPEEIPTASAEPIQDATNHGLGDEIVVVATYDGKWNKNNESAKSEGDSAASDSQK